MAITSKNKTANLIRYQSSHFKYSLTYLVITFIVLLFLNVYSSKTSQEMFRQSKESSMVERCSLVTAEISQLEVLNRSTASTAINSLGSVRVTRLILTDSTGYIIYDSYGTSSEGMLALFPEVMHALAGNDVFTWNYKNGAMWSRAAMPVVSYGTIIGCIYMMEYDTQQGSLLHSLQSNTFTITFFLELAVIVFALLFSTVYTGRLRKIMTSIRIIREGNYAHKVDLRGNDELSVLGDEFNDLTERLQTSENKRRQFVSDASHELKTPLASIKLLSDSILQNDMDTETIREFVGDIGNEAERLNRMSQKLLSLTHIESQPESNCEITYIAPTIDRVARMLSEIARSSSIAIETNIQKDCTILILEDDLYQIIFNLAENGIKYNASGGKLLITLSNQDDNAILKVQDTGMGIPEDSIPHIFERFYRVDKARSRQTGGSGLGLSIVRNMVERNGGKITVESALGQGTTFTVSFPVFDTEVTL